MSSQSVGLGFTSGDLALRMLSLSGFGICFWVVSDACLETAAACCNPLGYLCKTAAARCYNLGYCPGHS